MSNVKPFVFSIIKMNRFILNVLSQPSGSFRTSGFMQYTLDTFLFYLFLDAVNVLIYLEEYW